jgi:hypothetical protein
MEFFGAEVAFLTLVLTYMMWRNGRIAKEEGKKNREIAKILIEILRDQTGIFREQTGILKRQADTLDRIDKKLPG